MGEIECWSICEVNLQKGGREGKEGAVGREGRWEAHYMNQEYDEAQIRHWR